MSKSKIRVDDYMIKKWDRVYYTFFDINRNGTVDWQDFEDLFEEVKKLRGEESNEYKIAKDAMLTVWKGLLMQCKGLSMTDEVPPDAEISLAEWHDIWKNYDPSHMSIWQWEYLKFMFFLLDSSGSIIERGDKYVDIDEYSEVMKIYKLDPKESRLAFQCFALDKHNKKIEMIDYGMFVELWNEYFGSNDPEKRGQWLFGVVE